MKSFASFKLALTAILRGNNGSLLRIFGDPPVRREP
jgi:hypothetical protein